MKDLISVFAYCPDNHRKKILQDLLTQLQPIRDRFEAAKYITKHFNWNIKIGDDIVWDLLTK